MAATVVALAFVVTVPIALEGARAAAQTPAAPPRADSRRAELDAITAEIGLAADRQAVLRAEIAALQADGTALNETLLQTTGRVQDLETRLDATTRRLEALFANEDRVRERLRGRRIALGAVLAALQRMGRDLPPAVLVRPEDALLAVRSAILVGAVLPELRGEAETLAADLAGLLALRDEQERERDRLRIDVGRLTEERRRVELLLAEKRRAGAVSERALRDEQEHAERLGREAEGLKELIARVETEIPAAARAAGAALRDGTPVAALPSGGADLLRGAADLGEPDRISPAIAFASARGLLPLPVSGTPGIAFGAGTALDAPSEGVTFATRAGALVSTPADGWVVYSGPFRSYGQLLIINAGGGYHVLLAGMERIDVELGQFVLAGEPVAVMGARRTASAGGVDVGATQPVLYVEFRKDGNSIDPGPWWAQPNDEKVGG